MFTSQYEFIAPLAAFLMVLCLLATPALAGDLVANAEIENLKKRINALESHQVPPAQTEDQGLDFGQISKYVTLHGLLEAEASYTKPNDSDEESDLTLATAELSIEATLNEFVGGHIALLYEEVEGEDDDIDVDEAVISLTSPGLLFGQTPSVHAGRMYVPFGMFNSYMISDPLTLDLGETQDTAALVALEGDFWVLKVGVFNGDIDADGDKNQVDDFVASLELAPIENLAFGVSYINDLAESDYGLVDSDGDYADTVAGGSVFLSAQYGKFRLEMEYLAALDDFDDDDQVIEDLTGKRPEAWNVELAWMPTDTVQLAARYEEANDFLDDVKRYGATASYGLFEHVVIALEYLRAESDAEEDDRADIVTAQLALEF
ncbi:MAG: LbtU family siderophore porin [Deltaproteobacteria bacterium]|nr:LbtU family siderophore porin [Deltaproteobacteria bacterium]